MQLTKVVNFRADSRLVDMLGCIAESEGVSVSDVVRRAVEDRLARGAYPFPRPSEADPFSKLTAAARGSLQAQRDLADEATRLAFQRTETGELANDPETCLIEGLVLARLAAAQGDVGDQGRVIGMIALLAEVVGEESVTEQLGEAMARMALMADLKSGLGAEAADKAADAMVEMAGWSSAEVVAMAGSYATRIKDGIFAE
jgi:hypothetical protein